MSRFKNLEETFNLGSSDDTEETSDDVSCYTSQNLNQALTTADAIAAQFREFRGRDVHDQEMDNIAQMALDSHTKLLELGMDVEIRHAAEIFSSSAQMLKIGLDARNSKVDKKLKLLKLQMDRMKLENASAGSAPDPVDSIDGNAVMLDRNQLLAEALAEMEALRNKK